MSKKAGYRIPNNQKPCRFGNHWMEDLAGDGGSRCPMFECTYEGEKEIPEDFLCEENRNCVAYEPSETMICPKHDIEYYADGDWCELCHPEAEEWS